jgi:mannose-6-phosphate isomerase-like protein (cupin superfamily)
MRGRVKILMDSRGGWYASQVVNTDFEHAKLNVILPMIQGTKECHRHVGCDSVIIFREGEADFLWAPKGASSEADIQSIPIRPGQVVIALDGEWHGIRNTGPQPCKYLCIEGPQPPEGAEMIWIGPIMTPADYSVVD